jgi:hypothetical protein
MSDVMPGETPRETPREVPDAPLTEEAAHRVLARAVELDHVRSAAVPIARLREVARDAGISPEALEAALAEARAAQEPVPAPEPAWTTLRRSVVPNVLALAVFWLVFVALAAISREADLHWLVRKAASPVALLVGLGVALRLRAQVATVLLAGLAIAAGAELAMDVSFGVPSVRGAGAHFALILAAVLGVLAGALVPAWRSRSAGAHDGSATSTGSGSAGTATVRPIESAHEPGHEPARGRLPMLRPRLA